MYVCLYVFVVYLIPCLTFAFAIKLYFHYYIITYLFFNAINIHMPYTMYICTYVYIDCK